MHHRAPNLEYYLNAEGTFFLINQTIIIWNRPEYVFRPFYWMQIFPDVYLKKTWEFFINSFF